MKTLDVLPVQVPMRELRAMETEVRVLDFVSILPYFQEENMVQ